jgi:hypothetical protein
MKRHNKPFATATSAADAIEESAPPPPKEPPKKTKEQKPTAKATETKASKAEESRRQVRRAEELFSFYPRKVGKGAAVKAIVKALGLVEFDSLKAAVIEYRDCTSRWSKHDQQFIPHPATWFNGQHWDDDRKEWNRDGRASPGQSREERQLAECNKAFGLTGSHTFAETLNLPQRRVS